ncbi:MAG TPA: alpha/beta hydrolase [Vicinamibacterales bacterium]|nr:alpha/beta hydrolase [Vicinamibacterales bacterium]
MGVINGVLELLAVLTVVALAVRLLESRFAFFPASGETITPHSFGVEYDTLSIATADGERLHAWAMRPAVPHARIVYFHGNGGNLSVWAPILARIAGRGYSVLAFDYRGYGMSTGRPSERGLYRDVDAVIERTKEWQEQMIVVYWGRSLGCTMAAYAATVRAPHGLILESGFPSARSLVRSSPVLAVLAWFSSYRFPCREFLRRVNVPVLVMHGDDDHVVPIAQGRELFDGIVGRKRFVTIRGGDHNDLTPGDAHAYWRAVDEFIASVQTWES